MQCQYFGPSLLLALPEDVFPIISQFLSPRDILNLSLCCQNLQGLLDYEKVWFSQCETLGTLSTRELVEWRKGVSSYRALCRFLVNVKPLIGIWVHQNPELGNVVYVMPGFVSVVGCRIIPQELGPFGIDDGPILWAPVFEIIGDSDGSVMSFLHGRENAHDYFYPGSVKTIEKDCNVLLLEVEPRQHKNEALLPDGKSFAHDFDQEALRNGHISDSGLSKSRTESKQTESIVPFSRLTFSDRRNLLEIVTKKVRQRFPDLASWPLFARSLEDKKNFQKDITSLLERKAVLLQMCKHGRNCADGRAGPELDFDPTQLEIGEIGKNFDHSSGFRNSLNEDDGHTQSTKKKTFGGYFRTSIKQILGKSISVKGRCSSSSSSETKYEQLHQFLKSGETIGLTLHASTMKLSCYRAWPNMHDSRFALYKIPMCAPREDQEYAGLWGGTFGWPPGKPNEDKPGKALFFFLLSYEESQGEKLLIATKILEGTHYVLHPNGSAMFIVSMNEPLLEPFPWDTDADSLPVTVQNTYQGQGIANGYGFRYPGSKPGSLFVIQNGLLAFIWKESRAVLTLQRLNLQELLKKGERVPPLPPISNFSYLTKSYSNVFVGLTNISAS